MKRTSTSTQQKTTMKTKTNVKAGGHNLNHNESFRGVVVKTRVKAGKIAINHNESMR